MIVIENAKCPACGSRLGVLGNRITCQHTGCTKRDAAQRILEEANPHHLVEFTETDFSIQHPLAERLDNLLFTCVLHEELRAYAGPPIEPGLYAVGVEYIEGNAVRSFERLADISPRAGAHDVGSA